MKTQIEWTQAHVREARVFLYGVAAKRAIAGDDHAFVANEANELRGGEMEFRDLLAHIVGFDGAPIDAAVRRVDGLATGRLVRETVWLVRVAGSFSAEAPSLRAARVNARGYLNALGSPGDARVIRVTRIRKVH